MGKKIILFMCFFIFGVFCIKPSFAGENNPGKPWDVSSLQPSKNCVTEGCHVRINKEWSKTMHSNSAPSRDPLVKAFYDYLHKEKFDTGKCDKCHVPLRSLFPGEEENSKELFNEGVNCVFCHSVYGKNPEGGQGVDYYKIDFSKPLTGPTKSGQAAHDTKFLGMFKHVDICAGCHQSGEADYYIKEKKNLPCQQCHMPSKQKLKAAEDGKVRDKVYRHLFEGGHSELLLSMSAILSGDAVKKGDKTTVNITIENLALHPVPVGFPLRSIYLKVTAMDGNDEALWTNFQGNPATEAPDAYFALFFPKEEEIYVHCIKELKPLKDTRLKPGTVRQLSYEVPSNKKIESFQIQLYYRLLPESIVKKLGIDPALVPGVLMLEETVYVN